MNHRHDLALDLAEQLLAHSDLDVHDSQTTQHLLTHAFIRNPKRFASQLMRGLDEAGQVAERAGQVWAVATIREIVPDGLPTRLHELNRAARSGGAEVFAANPEHSLTQLAELFDDSDRSVRQAAASAVRRLERLDEQQTNDLIETFLAGAVANEDLDHLIHALADTKGTLPRATIDVCERAAKVGGRSLGDISTSWAGASGQLVTIVLQLYRQSNPEIRRRCLDIFDQLSELGAYGLSEALEKER